MAAENAQIKDGDTVAIWGCGPVGQFAIRSALLMGAGRVIAIDEVSERLAMAEAGGAETIDFSDTDVYDELMALTDNRGPDSCIDAVGCEASGHGAADATLDKVKAAAFLATDRVHVLRQAIMCCRKAGTVSIPGVYVGMGDKIPLGAAMNKGLHSRQDTRTTHDAGKASRKISRCSGAHAARLEDRDQWTEPPGSDQSGALSSRSGRTRTWSPNESQPTAGMAIRFGEKS